MINGYDDNQREWEGEIELYYLGRKVGVEAAKEGERNSHTVIYLTINVLKYQIFILIVVLPRPSPPQTGKYLYVINEILTL